MSELQTLHDAVLNGNTPTARTLTEEALAQGADPLEFVAGCMMRAVDEVGRRFECSQFSVPNLILSARAMKAALALVRPLLVRRGAEPVGRVVSGTVHGDLHDIGKNLVAAMLEGAGFEVTDLGVNVPPERFVSAVQEKGARIVTLSALPTTTMPAMRATIEALRKAGPGGQVKVFVGGAPITQKFADAIVPNMVYVWTGLAKAVGLRYYGIPGIHVPPTTGFNYIEPPEVQAWMREDEYDALIADPTAFLHDVWLPRVSTEVSKVGSPHVGRYRGESM
jgi:5-methyltetrahydrofolate--homocysteine methyltransferase